MPLPAVAVNVSHSGDLLLRVRNLRVDFGARAAIRDVSFDLFGGETLGLVGESGSGKSTLARAILRLVRAVKGCVEWRGQDLLSCGAAELRRQRRELQIVFQDPLASLNPRMTIGEIISEPLRIFEPTLKAGARIRQVGAMLDRVGLSTAVIGRYPHEFSGGQCQRIGIARAMILRPKLLICDEPVSSLDVSIQGQIVNLLLDLQRDAGTAMLFISHNLAVVRHLSHRILVIYSGRLVEIAPRDALFGSPIHPYTRALLAAVPSARPVPRTDTRPSPPAPPVPEIAQAPKIAQAREIAQAPDTGCAYRDRCRHALPGCATRVPGLEEVAPEHWVACHRARELIA
ncbi:MAG TPA: oligopeptide/dipeptide ABC transporter ATP-binding protein [Steroidobacteraceae bacterium]|jgi:oligopeptide transport system ATP-binding protein|nr:oligopeptide/dipeptide ABC transporter ATP-binding protein [Steroidobacteraceae bacterium]